jgi:hypothetical protein
VLLLLAAVMRRTRGRGVALPCRNQLQSHEKKLYAFQTFSLSGEIENTYTVRKKRGPALQKMCFFSSNTAKMCWEENGAKKISRQGICFEVRRYTGCFLVDVRAVFMPHACIWRFRVCLVFLAVFFD